MLKSAVSTRNGKSYVFRLEGHWAKETPLTLGETMAELLEIKAGLKEGDRVVLKRPPT